MATTMDVQQLKAELDFAQKVNEQMRVDLDQAGHRVLELEAKMKVISDMMESMKEKSVSEKKKWKLSEYKALFRLDCYEGDYKTYDDWKFKMKVFLSRREGMKNFLEWVTTEVKEPQDLKGFVQTYEVTSDVAKSLNEELYEVLCLKLRGGSLKTAKNLYDDDSNNGTVLWWKVHDEALGITGARIQGLASQVYKPKRVVKFAEVLPALEEYELACKLYGERTSRVSDDTKLFGVRQLVPSELELDIVRNAQTLGDWKKLKDYVIEQVTIRRDDAGPKRKTGMDLDTLTELHKLITDEDDWSGEGGESCCQELYRGKGGEADDIENKAQEILSFVKGWKGKGKGKGKGKFEGNCNHCGKFGHRVRECWQKDQEMEALRKGGFQGGGGKGKGSKGYGKGFQNGSYQSGGSWNTSNSNPWSSKGKGKGKGLFWFDQPQASTGNSVDFHGWNSSLERESEQYDLTNIDVDIDGFKQVEHGVKNVATHFLPGLPIPLLSANMFQHIEPEDLDEHQFPELDAEALVQHSGKKNKFEKMPKQGSQKEKKLHKKNISENDAVSGLQVADVVKTSIH